MLKTDKVIVVEGKYDAIRLANIVDAAILRTEGFGVFKDKEKQELLRTLAEKRGLLVLTDGDSAGMLIRNHIRGLVPAEQITDVYIPDLYGKEKRKAKPSKEGKLGVEGIPDDILIEALKRPASPKRAMCPPTRGTNGSSPAWTSTGTASPEARTAKRNGSPFRKLWGCRNA